MPNGFYYLISSLPELFLDKKPLITQGSLLEECAKWLSPEQMKTLQDIAVLNTDFSSEKENLSDQWKTFDMALLSQLANVRSFRKQKLQVVPEIMVQDIEKETDPLKKEYIIAQKQLEYLSEIVQGHEFDLDYVMVYYLKLLIIERINSFNKEKGQEVFQSLCEVKYE